MSDLGHLLERFARPSPREFEEALHMLSAAPTTEERIALSRRAMEALSKQAALSRRERDRRLRIFLERIVHNEEELALVASLRQVRELGFANVLMSLLPPPRRRVLANGIREDRKGINVITEIGLPEEVKTPTRSAAHSVALLGSEADHVHNKAILGENGFVPLRIELKHLSDLNEQEICGIVVARSFWGGLEQDRHEEALREICRFTSLLFIRIDEDLLDVSVASKISDIQHTVYGREQDSSLFCHGYGCKIMPSDLATLRRVAGLLEASSATHFHPDEINESEAFLLRVAATRYVRGANPSATLTIERLRTGFLPGGLSRARIALVSPDDDGAPVVAKIHDLSQLQREVANYQSYIRRWDDRVQPQLFFHGKSALLLYRLLDSAGTPGRPAPTLHERLEKLLNSELGSWGERPPAEDDIETMINRAVARVGELNKHPSDKTVKEKRWVSNLKELAEKGIVWRVESLQGQNVDLVSLSEQMERQAERLNGAAVVHGDLHLNNILVNDDVEPLFIDFAESGPGHPCYDLVRLGSAVCFSSFRMLDSEDVVRQMLHGVLVEGLNFDEARSRFPHLFSSSGNRLAIKTAVAVRAECLRVAQFFGGNEADYRAVQFLVACQALTMMGLQSGIARALLGSLSG